MKKDSTVTDRYGRKQITGQPLAAQTGYKKNRSRQKPARARNKRKGKV
jgi:hypothetical protein